MTQAPIIRIFFAIDLPENIKQKVNLFMHTLKEKTKNQAIRWVKAENLHVTLQFLAAVQVEHLPLLIKQVKAEMEGSLDHLMLTIGDVNLFPHPSKPRALVLDVGPQQALANMAMAIGRGIQATHYEIDTRPFRAHLTLGRIKYTKGDYLCLLSGHTLPAFPPVTIKEVVLFQSEPQSEGSSCYTPLEKIALGAHRTDQL